MVTVAQAQKGIARFVDAEVVSRLSVMEKLVVGGGAGLIAAKLPDVLNSYADNKFVSTLGLYDRERGEIDVDALYNAAKPYIGADPIPVTVPFVGITLKFTQREFDALYQYIKEA